MLWPREKARVVRLFRKVQFRTRVWFEARSSAPPPSSQATFSTKVQLTISSALPASP